MKIILLGYNSFIANSILKHFESQPDIELICVGRKKTVEQNILTLQIVKNEEELKNKISRLLDDLNLGPDCVIINCISMSDVDRCEVEQEECRVQNFLFVKFLYQALRQYDFKKLIHFSSNAVYDGYKAPYCENSVCEPINYYGKIKLEADNFLLGFDDQRVMVVRPITLYGKMIPGGRHNPVSLIIDSIENDREINLVNDVLVNILFVEDLVKAIERLLLINYCGSINIAGDEIYSRYTLGLRISEILNKGGHLIREVSSSEFKTAARRPLNTSFDNTLMKEKGIFPRTLKQVLSKF